jgi:hypothetical protein
MKTRSLLIAIALLFAALAAGWWFVASRSMQIRISEAEILAALAPRFPLAQTHFLVLQLELDSPRLRLLEDKDRIAMGIDARLAVNVGRQREPIGASIDLETGLRYVASDASFYLDQPQITALDVSGVPEKWSKRAREVLSAAAGVAVTRTPIYTLKSEDARQAAARMVLRDVRVEGKELVVTLGL